MSWPNGLPRPKGPREHALAALLALAVVLVLTLGLVAVGAVAQQTAAAADAERAQRVLRLLAQLQTGLVDAAPAADVQARLGVLRADLSADAEQYTRLVALAALLERRADAPAAATGSQRGAIQATDPQRGALQTTDPQRRAMQAADAGRLRGTLAEMQQHAEVGQAAAHARSNDAATAARDRVVAASTVALLGLALVAAALLQQRRMLRGARSTMAASGAAEHVARDTLQRVWDGAPDALCIVDSEGRFTRVNAALQRLWGRPADALLGAACTEQLLADDQRRAELALTQALAGAAPPPWRCRLRRGDGSVAQLAWHASAPAADATLLCTVRDIGETEALHTDAAAQAAALRDATAQGAAALARLDGAEQMKTQLLASLQRHLRAPSAAVAGHAQTLLQGLAGPLAAEQQRQLASLHQHALRLQRAADALLTIAALDAGRLVLEREPFDLWESVHKVVAAARPAAEHKGLALQLQIADEPGYARGDPARVEELLRELLANAIRCTDAGSVSVQVARQGDGTVRIAVADTGCGFGAAAQALAGGAETGLGLALAQRLARAMGGSVALNAQQPAHGSVVALTLPADAMAAQ